MADDHTSGMKCILYYCFQAFFDSLYSLITHYQQNPLVSPKFSITLGRAVPRSPPAPGTGARRNGVRFADSPSVPFEPRPPLHHRVNLQEDRPGTQFNRNNFQLENVQRSA